MMESIHCRRVGTIGNVSSSGWRVDMSKGGSIARKSNHHSFAELPSEDSTSYILQGDDSIQGLPRPLLV